MIKYFNRPKGTIKSPDGKFTKNVLWGDWLDVEETAPPSSKYLVKWHNWNRDTDQVWTTDYLVAKRDCRDTPLLEMIFLDVGQGDGCIVSIPDGNGHKTLIVDAGVGDNMLRFIRWKTRGFRVDTSFHAAILTHPDQDHYKGFQPLFDRSEVSFEKVYHNGLVERVTPDGTPAIGPKANGYCTDIIETRAALTTLLADPAKRGGKLYPKLLWTALSDPSRFGDIVMLSTLHGEATGGRSYLPGFSTNGPGAVQIEILGPVPAPDPAGTMRLPVFDDAPPQSFKPGKTKNGNSVILRLEYRGFSAIFGGDLNRPAEEYLLRHYSGIPDTAPLEDAIAPARSRWQADLLKCCHHGSADVTDEFVETVNAFAMVVSSGDQESHVHPRPEILGLLGKKGRGRRPLILSTEMQRSSPEKMELSKVDMGKLDKLMDAYKQASAGAMQDKARKAVDRFWQKRLQRLVAVYGAINVRTDGNSLVVAFKKEAGGGWQIFEYAKSGGEWAEIGGSGH